MRDMEEVLRNKKVEFDNLEVPDELESRLKNALEKESLSNKSKINWRMKLASFIILIILIGYNFDTLAYYGKKLVGFEPVMSSTLKELNELGKGQIIDKSFTFKNGIIVTLDGIMVDDNQLILFYTEKSSKGKLDQNGIESFMKLKGIVGNHNMRSGSGKSNDENTEIKWVMEFDAPYFFEKKLKWQFQLGEGTKTETGEIDFTLDRNKAMGHSLKMNINQAIYLDNRKISFDSILASQTTTVIKGTIENILQLAKDQINGERVRPEMLNIKLIANGKEIQTQGSGMSTDLNGIKFDCRFESLPKDLKNLQLELVNFAGDYDAKAEIVIDKTKENQSHKILGQNIEIKKVYEEKGETFVTISSEESVVLSKVKLIADANELELQSTSQDQNDKISTGTIIHTRTLRFKGTGKELKLKIDRIRFNKAINEIINIM